LRRWGWPVTAGVLAFAIGLVVYLPASVAIGWLGGVPGARLEGVTGTALEGRAARVLVAGAVIDDVRWRMRFMPLLKGRLGADTSLATEAGTLRASVSRGLEGRVRLAEVTGPMPLERAGRLAGFSYLPLSGTLTLDLQRVELDGQTLVGAAGQVGLRGARWKLLRPPAPLGTHTARVRDGEDGVTAEVVDTQGPIAVGGQASLDREGRYRLNLTLRPRAGADQRLRGLLSQLGEPDAQGRYRINAKGQL